MSEEKIKINKLDGSITFINNGISFSQFGIAKEILDLITNLQQKVEQLEKENIKQKEIIENLTTMTVCGDKKQIKNTAQYKLEQLESIRKEAIEFTNSHFKEMIADEEAQALLNILNKGDNNVKDKR